MKKIGIMGGTFNPIHNGHLEMARRAYEQFELDEVWFMPTKNPPHKENSEIVSNAHRAEMISLAIKDKPFFILSTLEYEREGITYTKDTLEEVAAKYPEDYFYFIIGSDSLAYIETWQESEKLLSMAHILSAPRYPSNLQADNQKKAFLEEKYGADIQFIVMEPVMISSHEIRSFLKAGKEVGQFLPDPVVSYIEQNRLYGTKKAGRKCDLIKYDILELQNQLKDILTEKRYAHTIGVQHTAACLAMCYDEDIKKASVAGLLHDCAKCLSDEELLQECERHHIAITPLERRNPYLLHGKLGAYYAKSKYGIKEEDILEAIRYHTTGKPAMTLLEKIIFIADYIEPLRKDIPGLSAIRKEVFADIDKAVYMVLENTLNYLKHTAHGQKKEIDEMTVRAYEYYKEGKENE